MAYDDFCEAVARAGRETATTIICKCEGWYKASETVLKPAIEEEKNYAIDNKSRICFPKQTFPKYNNN